MTKAMEQRLSRKSLRRSGKYLHLLTKIDLKSEGWAKEWDRLMSLHRYYFSIHRNAEARLEAMKNGNR